MATVSTKGEQTLFFSKNEADASWRLKEKIVAVIESYLQDREDISTFSSTRIRDVVNDLEEVDIAYTSMSDPTEYFSFVEVRDRSSKVGRPYIQEVMGKRRSLGIDNCKIVSTKGFSQYAKRLASHQGIPLRRLVPETDENIKRWFKPDIMRVKIERFELVKCSVVVSIGDKAYEYRVEQEKMSEGSILVPTEESNRYRVTSLSRVFDLNIIQNSEVKDKLAAGVPADGKFHETGPVQYEPNQLYLRAKEAPPAIMDKRENYVYPIEAIVFFPRMSNTPKDARITERYKYLDAISGEKIAELPLANFEIGRKRHYACLVRYNCDDEGCQIGGALFQ